MECPIAPGSTRLARKPDSGAGYGPAGSVCLSESKSNGNFTPRAALHLSATTVLRIGGIKEQPCVIWGVIASIYIIIVQ